MSIKEIRKVRKGIERMYVSLQRMQQTLDGMTVDDPPWIKTPYAVVSRKEAKERGLVRYRTGEECMRGHADWRFTSNGGCVICAALGGGVSCE